MARPLSLLDLTPIAAGLSATKALQEATDLAVLADRPRTCSPTSARGGGELQAHLLTASAVAATTVKTSMFDSLIPHRVHHHIAGQCNGPAAAKVIP